MLFTISFAVAAENVRHFEFRAIHRGRWLEVLEWSGFDLHLVQHAVMDGPQSDDFLGFSYGFRPGRRHHDTPALNHLLMRRSILRGCQESSTAQRPIARDFAFISVAFRTLERCRRSDFRPLSRLNINNPLPACLSTLHVQPCDYPRMTRGQVGSLRLTCTTLSFATSRRFIPANSNFGPT
jgi:hypothetical protein